MSSTRTLVLASAFVFAAASLAAGHADAQTRRVRPQPVPRAEPVQPREDQSFLYLAPTGNSRGPANYVSASNSMAATALNPLMYGQGYTNWLQR